MHNLGQGDGCGAGVADGGSAAPASPARRRLLHGLVLLAGGAALWPSAAFGADNGPGAAISPDTRRSVDGVATRTSLTGGQPAPDIEPTSPFAPSPRPLDRAGLLREASTVVARQVREVGAPAEYARRVGSIAERVAFQAPFEFLVTSYYEREPERRDALLALYARDPRQAIRELGPAFPSPRAEMTLATFAYYDVSADRIRVNLGRVPEQEAARVLVHEFWHALPVPRTWNEGNGATFRTSGFWTQQRRMGGTTWDPVDDTNGLPCSPYLLNEAMATRMEVGYAGPLRFKRPDLETADAFLARLTDAAGTADVMHAYLESLPTELTELAGQHSAALTGPGTVARR